jgi:hypothetical protein
LSGAEEFGEGEFGFAEAAAGDEDPVAFGGVKNLILKCVETEIDCTNVWVRRSWRIRVHE